MVVAFSAEFYVLAEDSNPTLLGLDGDTHQASETKIQDLAKFHCTERKDRVSTFLARYLHHRLQLSFTEQKTALVGYSSIALNAILADQAKRSPRKEHIVGFVKRALSPKT